MEILRYTAFTSDPAGGNPAGVVLPADGLSDTRMQEIAAELGFSETAFVSELTDRRASVRYFAPAAEVPFCGHATIATGVALAERHGAGAYVFATPVGDIAVDTEATSQGFRATLTSVEPQIRGLEAAVRTELLAILNLAEADLDPELPTLLAFAGNWHPIIPVATVDVLDGFDYDYEALRTLMAEQGWQATVDVVLRTGAASFEARNPFPPGGMREDSATGSAAASLGAYLRHLRIVEVPATVMVAQGRHMGRPSTIEVHIPEHGGILVTGSAVELGA
ncbi:PhzF family phenazine biosynthesis protein [Arthrobacter sp. 35W]|uniref:PhzF family phenazine biosynthesis protein n=1 Tax=Arthrobacter sp. 35W TaxID=1132441 RepID=UPI000408D7B4|nr:PhzF family phenazine biosynthesis isomerase [Arthrobacter sp. 35W]